MQRKIAFVVANVNAKNPREISEKVIFFSEKNHRKNRCNQLKIKFFPEYMAMVGVGLFLQKTSALNLAVLTSTRLCPS
jgi:hypothetical protein